MAGPSQPVLKRAVWGLRLSTGQGQRSGAAREAEPRPCNTPRLCVVSGDEQLSRSVWGTDRWPVLCVRHCPWCFQEHATQGGFRLVI